MYFLLKMGDVIPASWLLTQEVLRDPAMPRCFFPCHQVTQNRPMNALEMTSMTTPSAVHLLWVPAPQLDPPCEG